MKLKHTIQFALTQVWIAGFCILQVQAQQNTFSEVLYDSAGVGIQAFDMVRGVDGGYLIAGNALGRGAELWKIDSSGHLLWNKDLHVNQQPCSFYTIIANHDSGYILAGELNTGINYDAFCVKADAKGNPIWSKVIHTASYNTAIVSILKTMDGGYIMTGFADPIYPLTDYKIFVARLDASGNLQWSNLFANGNGENFGSSIKQTSDSGFIVSGYSSNKSPFEEDAFLIKLSPDGTVNWAKNYQVSQQNSIGNDVQITSNGFLYYLSTQYTILVKTDFSGNILWTKSYDNLEGGIGVYPKLPGLHKTQNNGYVFVGSNLTKIDTSGNIQWTTSIFLNTTKVITSNDGGFYVLGDGPLIGAIAYTAPHTPQVGIIKTDSAGIGGDCTFPSSSPFRIDTITASPANVTSLTGVSASSVFPASDTLLINTVSGCVSFLGGVNQVSSQKSIKIFPNPSNGIFTVDAGGSEPFQLTIMNTVGQIIYQGEMDQANNTIDLHANPDGIYFYRITIPGRKNSSGKLIISH